MEFLQKKGFEIKEDPNAVVPEEGYKLLIEEFSADKKARIQSDNFTKERQNKEKPKAAPVEAPKAEEPKPVVKPAPEAPKKEEPKIKVTGRIDLDALKRKSEPKKKEEEPKKKEEPVKEEKPVVVEEPAKEEPKVEEPAKTEAQAR